MEREYEYLLAILKAFLLEQTPEKRENVDWKKLAQLSRIHCVTGILGYMTMKYPICPDGALCAALRRGCLETIALFTRRGKAMEELSALLGREQIRHIVMKGYVLRECYPVPELRTYGDIDFVIRPEDRQRVHRLMLDQGFRTENDWEPVFGYVREPEYYEAHTQILEPDILPRWNPGDLWQHTQPSKGFCLRFTPEFHFLYLIAHIAKHVRGSGAGARMYLDVAAFARRFGGHMDWARVRRELEEQGLRPFAGTVLSCCSDWFGVETPLDIPRPEPDVLAEFTAFTMEAGIFGRYQREGGVVTLKNESAHPEDKLGALTHRLFPAAGEIDSRYTYLQDKPWLLPAAWVHRLIKTGAALPEHAREAAGILSADREEVKRLRSLMEAVGLAEEDGKKSRK